MSFFNFFTKEKENLHFRIFHLENCLNVTEAKVKELLEQNKKLKEILSKSEEENEYLKEELSEFQAKCEELESQRDNAQAIVDNLSYNELQRATALCD